MKKRSLHVLTSLTLLIVIPIFIFVSSLMFYFVRGFIVHFQNDGVYDNYTDSMEKESDITFVYDDYFSIYHESEMINGINYYDIIENSYDGEDVIFRYDKDPKALIGDWLYVTACTKSSIDDKKHFIYGVNIKTEEVLELASIRFNDSDNFISSYVDGYVYIKSDLEALRYNVYSGITEALTLYEAEVFFNEGKVRIVKNDYGDSYIYAQYDGEELELNTEYLISINSDLQQLSKLSEKVQRSYTNWFLNLFFPTAPFIEIEKIYEIDERLIIQILVKDLFVDDRLFFEYDSKNEGLLFVGSTCRDFVKIVYYEVP